MNCKKKIDCPNAQLCVKNIGSDTILFCWGCNLYEDTLLPGKSACINVGSVYIDYKTEDTKIQSFYSDHGNYGILVNECNEEKEIR